MRKKSSSSSVIHGGFRVNFNVLIYRKKAVPSWKENHSRFQTRCFAKMAARHIVDYGGGIEQEDGEHGGGDDEEESNQSVSVEEGLVQQSDEIINEWNDCLEHMGKLGKVAEKITRVMREALAENVGEKEMFGGKLWELGKLVKCVKEFEEYNTKLEQVEEIKGEKIKKMCNFNNRGYCKKGVMCPFKHPEEICDSSEDERVKCLNKECQKRPLQLQVP